MAGAEERARLSAATAEHLSTRHDRSLSWREADTVTTIPRCFVEQARLHPARPAIAGTSWEPSYRELDMVANQVAQDILERCGVGHGRIALLMRHDAPLIAATLGVLKAGRTAVVLNQSDPPQRLAQIRSDVGSELIVADERHRELTLRAGWLAEELMTPELAPGTAPGVDGRPDDLAALLYTAGSTGRPKGVMQTHRNALHNVLRQTKALGVHAGDRIAVLASLSGGQGFTTTWLALMNGATLCPFPAAERGITGLSDWLASNGVTVLVSTASLFRQFARTSRGSALPAVRLVRLAGEPVRAADVEAFRRYFSDTCVFTNTLSLSEAGHVAAFSLTGAAELPDGPVPVGRPGEGIDLRLVDEWGAEVTPGEVGEIVVRSDYLSPGYWGDEELTAQRFVEDASGRSFRSGDLGRFSGDGLLTLVGRRDSMIKVRGFRVEVSEVERALSRCPGVEQAVVCARPAARGQVLAAYVVALDGHDLDAAALREALRGLLPEYAVPGAFIFLEALPVAPNGKVDRRRLAEMELPLGRTERMEPPVNETEELLCGIWATALERDEVGRSDDFLDLGGDSLTAAVIAAVLHATLGVTLELSAFTERPTVAQMAPLIGELQSVPDSGDRPPLVRVPRTEPLPMSFMQEWTWGFSRTPEESAAWTTATGFQIRGALDVPRFRRAIDCVIQRQEILRTTYHEREGRPVQVVHDPQPVELPLVDLSSTADPEAAAAELLASGSCERFDVERLPQFRLWLAKLADDYHWLIRVSHHINTDNYSWRILLEQVSRVYGAELRGAASPLQEEKPIGYADFAAWERRVFSPESRRYLDDVAWWRTTLAGAPVRMPLPFSRRAPEPEADHSEGVLWFGLHPDASRELAALRRKLGATYFMGHIAIFAALLAGRTGNDDLVIGTYATTRGPAETYDMFGFFGNPVALRLRFQGDPGFVDWLASVRTAVIEMSAHSQIPYSEVCKDLRRGGLEPPQLQAILSAWGTLPPMRFEGLEISPLKRAFGAMPWGFTIQLDPYWETERCLASFDARVHDPGAVRSFIADYQRLLGAIASEPDRPLSELLPGPPAGRRAPDKENRCGWGWIGLGREA
jgi:amino acid adenylation domain-containing protein